MINSRLTIGDSVKKVKLADMSFKELEALRSDIDDEIVSRQRKQAAIEEIRALAAAKGINLEDLSREIKTSPGRGSLGPAPVKYRHPSDPDKSWSGRGLKPKWFNEALNSGFKLEDLQVS